MIISLANQKGGVGKTTTCINLASGLAIKRKKVLVIDLDPQGNTTSGLGVEKQTLTKTTYDVLVNSTPLEEVIIDTGRKNLSLCPCTIDLAGAEIELVDADEREYVLKKAIERINDRYDEILIDCPPSLNLLTINALCASDGILIPVQAEFYAMEGLTQLLSTVTAVKENWNSDLDVFGVLLTMVDSRTQLAKQVSEEIRTYFKDKVFTTEIPRNVRLSEAPSHGKSIFEYEKWSKGARAYEKVIKEWIRREKSAE